MRIPILNKSPYDLPQYATAGSAGMDLRANLEQPLSLRPLERCLVPTGLFLAIPRGFEGQIRPRSGQALKKGLSIPNAPGTIDSDYRGEVKVLLINLSEEPQTIEPGERIAQLVICPVVQAQWEEVSALADTQRAEGGFGSTGKV